VVDIYSIPKMSTANYTGQRLHLGLLISAKQAVVSLAGENAL